MKLFLLALTVAIVTATPLPPSERNAEPVELIVNGVQDGEPLEIGDIVDIKLKHHVDGQIAAVSDLLYPLTAQGIADAVAAAEAENESDVHLPILPEPAPLPELEPIVLPQPELPVVPVPEPIVLPTPELPVVQPEVPVIVPELPGPEIIPGPIIIPSPEIVDELEVVDAPEVVEAPQFPNGEIFNDGNVQITVNTPNDSGIIPTIQSWLQIFLNYFNNGVQTTHQIV